MKKAFFQLHLAILFAGFTGIFGKLIDLNEGILVFYRMLLSAIMLFIYLIIAGNIRWPKVRDLWEMFGIGAIVALHWVAFYGSIRYSNVSVAVTCLSAIGFFTSFLEPLLMRRRIDLLEVGLGLLVIAGIYLIFNFYPEYQVGLIFGILSAFFASIFPILNKIALAKNPPIMITAFEMTGGFLCLCLILPIYLGFFKAAKFLPGPIDWLWLVILALVCTVISFVLSLKALKHISAFTANLSYNLEPIYSIILAFLLFKEHKFLGPGFYAGFTLIVMAVILQMVREWRLRRAGKFQLTGS